MTRIDSVDSFRVLAILAVIVIHTVPFGYGESAVGEAFDLATVANQLARFAVPFFFVVTGFFWGKKTGTRAQTFDASIKMSKRLATLFVFWSLIYILPFNPVSIVHQGPIALARGIGANVQAMVDHPFRLLFEGTKGHLWFLAALLCCLMISALFVAFDKAALLLILAVALYAVGLLGKAYANTPLGIQIQFNTRNGPFFGLLFFVSGYLLSRRKPQESWFAKGLALTVLGYCVHFLELYFLHRRYGTTLAQDYLVGTYLLGLGSALMALSNHAFLRLPALRAVGPRVLGIYAIHVVFVELLYPVRLWISSPLWDIAYVLLVFALSFFAVSAMVKTGIGRRMVA